MGWRTMPYLLVCVASLLGVVACGPAASLGGNGGAAAKPSPLAASATSAPTSTVAPLTTGTPEPRSTPTASTRPKALPAPGLTVEEYPVVSKDVDAPTHFEYMRRIDPMVLEKRKQWREVAPPERMARANEVLSKFGYRLTSTEKPGCPLCVSFQLYRQGTLMSDVEIFRQPALAEDGSDFAMLIEDRRARNFVARKDGLVPWAPEQHGFIAPAVLGNELLAVSQPDTGKCEVRKGKEILYSMTLPPQRVDNPIKGLYSWAGKWVLEVDGTVIVDSRSLNKENGYDEVFGWRLVKGEPFYFFRKGNVTGVSYAGQVLSEKYDEVVHYRCCEPAAFNDQGNDNMVWFHALRGGTYYYVEMGRYESPASGVGA